MAAKRIDMLKNPDAAVAAAAEVLEASGVIVFPTETVYGIAVIAGDAAALGRLRQLKGRDAGKPFQYLTENLQMAKDMGAVFDTHARKLARNYWPGPLTLVVPDGTGSGSTLGIRVPDSLFVRNLCRRLGKALTASSANPACAEPPLDADAADVFGDAVGLLADGGPIAGGVPSTVVACEGNTYTILREGAVGREAIEAAWNE